MLEKAESCDSRDYDDAIANADVQYPLLARALRFCAGDRTRNLLCDRSFHELQSVTNFDA